MSEASAPAGLLLDLQALQSPTDSGRGIGRYVSELTQALLRRPGLVRAVLLDPDQPPPPDLHPRIRECELVLSNDRRTMRRLLDMGPAAYCVMSPMNAGIAEALMPRHVIDAGLAVVSMVYDLIPMVMPDRYLASAPAKRRYRARLESLGQSDLILAVSAHTRKDVLKYIGVHPARVVEIGAGVGDMFRARADGANDEAVLPDAVRILGRSYALAVTGVDPRKNTERLISAWARLSPMTRQSHALVVSCSMLPGEERAWRAHAADEGLSAGDLVLTNRVTDSELLALYRGARLLVMPSLYEGYGLPVAEALACGCPVVTSRGSSLGELLDWPRANFDPLDPVGMARVIDSALGEGAYREELLERCRRVPRPTWDGVADRFAHAVSTLPVAPPRPLPTRVALATPLPPVRSGVADYNHRLAAELSRHAELDILVVGGGDRDSISPEVGRRLPLRALGRHASPASYDVVIYAFGNSAQYLEMWPYMHRYPGIVWLHDVRLPGFYISLAEAEAGFGASGDAFILDAVESMYGHTTRDRVAAAGPRSRDTYARLELGMAREVLGLARGVIVSSGFARDLLAKDAGPGRDLPPVAVIPLAAGAAEGRSADRAHPPVVATFGLVDDVKAPGPLLRALALLAGDVRLVFVGPISEQDREGLTGLAAELGIAGRVEFTGDLPRPQYTRWLRTASVAIQVRTTSHGEGSAAVSDALAAGVPVVTNISACREFPAGTVDVIDDIQPESIAAHVGELLSDPARAEAQARRGSNYARTRTYAAVAAALMDFIADIPEGDAS
ncbi:MAG: glycosyltransferase [Candidatus Dormibacteria bacterium]